MTDSVVVEGYVRLRDGRRWKSRWVALRKPSPVADCLVLLVFKDKSDKAQGHKERASVTLEDICGLETGQWFEGVSYTLAVLCLGQAAVLGFDSKETLQAWDIRIRYSLGEVHRFNVGVLPGTKLESGPATLHLCNNLLALARDVPPVIIGHWNLPDLRRYGPVSNGFVFEGGTRCGYWAGVFFLASAESEQISFLFDCIVRGVSPSRGPFGLQPVLPDPNASPASVRSEERVNHEAQELERRLSMLSHRCSTASSSYSPSVAGDDRSISGSSDASDTSQSDCSVGSRLAIWAEPAPSASPTDSIGHVGSKAVAQSTEKLSVHHGGGPRPVTKAPRQLQEIGRQSSSDSGIATGSHSSYSGSFSSYTGSLDSARGEDFGSVFSLPPHLAADLSPCTCAPALGHEYQVPTSLRLLYDTPRRLMQEGGGADKDNETSTSTGDNAAPSTLAPESPESAKVSTAVPGGQSVVELSQVHQESKRSKVASSGESQHSDSCQVCTSVTSNSKTIFTICATCGGFKRTAYTLTSGSVIPAVPDQGVEKSACRPSSEYNRMFSVWTEAIHSSDRLTGKKETALPKSGREKLATLLADLLGHPDAGLQETEAEKTGLGLYESMSFGLGTKLQSNSVRPLDFNSLPGKSVVIYENCFKCREEHCRPPRQVAPSKAPYSANYFSISGVDERNHAGHGTVLPSQRHLQTSASEVAGNGRQPLTAQFGLEECPYEEMADRLAIWEEKRANSKEERRRVDPAYEIMESRALEKNCEMGEKNKYELMGSCGHQRFPHETEVFVFPPEAPLPCERPRGDGVTYVNIPISPTSKKLLNYMELELQETGAGTRAAATHLPAPRKSSTKYAHIDITATETAHKVGTQHALGREEGLHTLELRRKGAPQ